MVDKTKAFPKTGDMCGAGMDLRDYFAAKAMQGFITGDFDLYEDEIVTRAYRIADAMMEARKK